MLLNLAIQVPTWPNIDKWMDLVDTYSARDPTNDEDVVNAFAGTTPIFNSVFHKGILWGMPEMFFLIIACSGNLVMLFGEGWLAASLLTSIFPAGHGLDGKAK
jgi:hypothetical protein